MSVNTEIGLDLMLSVDNPAKAMAEIEKIVGGGTIAGLDDGMKKAQSSVQKSYYTALVGALRLSNKEVSKNLQEEFKQRTDKIKHLGNLMQRQQRQLERAEQRRDGRTKHMMQQRLAANRKRIAEEQKAIKNMADKQMSAMQDRLEMLDEGLNKAATTFGDKLETAGAGFENIMQQALSVENLDPSSLIKGLGGALKDAAPSLMAGGAKMASGGGAGGMLGKAAMALGASAGMIAGAAAAIGAVVAVFAAAYSQTKEFNKAISDASGALDLMARGARSDHGDLAAAYTEVRHAVQDHAAATRQSTDAVMTNLTQMHESGFTFRQMQDTYGGYEQVLFQATSAMGTFGVEANDVGTFLKTLTMDMGLGVEGIADAFDSVYGAAQLSSMSTKDFFTSISELTSGMALYNFRLEDTVELFTALEDTLGADAAKELLGGLKGKFRGMGFQERYETTMKAGSAGRGVLEAARGRQEDAFNEALKERGDIQALLEQMGLAQGGEINMTALENLRGAELGAVQNALGGIGDEQALSLSRSIDQLAELARGSRQGATLGQRATAMGSLGMEGTLAMDMVSAFALLGEKGLGDMEGIDRIAFEQITGLGGEQFEAMKDIFNRQAAAMGAEGKANKLSDVAEAIAAGDIQLSDQDREALSAAKDAGMDEMERLAVESLKETTSISQTLKNKVVGLLESAAGFLGALSSKRGDKDMNERAQKREGLRQMTSTLDTFRESLTTELEEATKTGSPEEIAALEARLDATNKGIALGRRGAAGGNINARELGLAYQAATGMDVSREAFHAVTGKGYTSSYDAGGTTEVHEHGAIYIPDMQYVFDEGEISLKTLVQMAEKQGLVVQDPMSEKALSDIESTNQAAARALKEIRRAMTRDQYLDISEATGMGVGSIARKMQSTPGQEELKQALRSAKNQLAEDDVTGRNKLDALASSIGVTLDDFIYRGGAGGGVVHPINRYDELIGMTTAARGGGTIMGAMGAGRGVTINNLTINESGDPKKTLAMVKQAIRAAQGA